MIQDLTLRWGVTVLLALCVVAFSLAIAHGTHGRWVGQVGQALHVVMAVAMAVMAWPEGAKLPTTGPMVFFLSAAAWFAVLTVAPVGSGHRVTNAYHNLMMLAMSWMYAVMNGHLLPGQCTRHGNSTPEISNMPGMGTPGSDMSGGHPGTVHDGGGPVWITAVNWVITIGFALATVVWTYRYFMKRQTDSTECADQRPAIAGQAMMAAGMAIMFGVML
ncbi:MAG TPA: DUF5134 domain-containing protein [Mycobacterium sp.]|nr:DUF5134 domain-containing protein [Mycobacterium sp.]